MDIFEAQKRLERAGLKVKRYNLDALYINDPNGLPGEACAIDMTDNTWLAMFPGPDTSLFEIPGSLQELVILVKSVYDKSRSDNILLGEAVEGVLGAEKAKLYIRSEAAAPP
jgi:hypothetical protein